MIHPCYYVFVIVNSESKIIMEVGPKDDVVSIALVK